MTNDARGWRRPQPWIALAMLVFLVIMIARTAIIDGSRAAQVAGVVFLIFCAYITGHVVGTQAARREAAARSSGGG
ncbi:hypothetical protein [Streptomyces sp. NBC_00151]|uniref:hypothetical protein n=1 Tax=Streptomyces sp. NBC_00151 TaxID=2975669 RepID=UPI002DD917BD|nr:hypothetical protein [Streptomyces sp. NBC_00151]WRZ41711.1 hypothetical protein OG915_28935 [Streptomyces sp. NBC_00151]